MRLAVVDANGNVLIAWGSPEIARRAVANLAARRALQAEILVREMRRAVPPPLEPARRGWRFWRRPAVKVPITLTRVSLEEELGRRDPPVELLVEAIDDALVALCRETAKL